MHRLVIIFIVVCLFSSCRKDKTINPADCVADLYKNDQLKSSVQIRNMSSTYEGSLTASGIGFVEEMSSLSEIWFKFDVTKGDPYRIWWQDSWWEEFTAGSIYVTAFMSDTVSTYFAETRIIAQESSPLFIVANETGSVFLRVRPYDFASGSVVNFFDEATFAVHCDSLLGADEPVLLDSLYHLNIDSAGFLLFSANVMKDSSYQILADGSPNVGAYGDEVSVNMSVIPNYGHMPYFFEQQVTSSAFGYPELTLFEFVAQETGKIYIAFNAAYWWTTRSFDFKISKIP